VHHYSAFSNKRNCERKRRNTPSRTMANPEKRKVLERPPCEALTRFFLLNPATQRGSKRCTTNFNSNRAALLATRGMTRERNLRLSIVVCLLRRTMDTSRRACVCRLRMHLYIRTQPRARLRCLLLREQTMATVQRRMNSHLSFYFLAHTTVQRLCEIFHLVMTGHWDRCHERTNERGMWD
jgi:hypothetical protein